MQHRIRIIGIVQGIGFRPFVKRLADAWGVTGSVMNRGSFVEVMAFGNETVLMEFEHRLKTEAPKASKILKLEVEEVDGTENADQFRILESLPEKGLMLVSPDLAICPDCERELLDPRNRRYLHPFINCTNCGPRMTILDSMPYDRIRTSMRMFPMCQTCAKEYAGPKDRRFHAQPICCKEDGPKLQVVKTETTDGFVTTHFQGEAKGDDEAICFTRKVIRSGGIAAVKGIGGFHLALDARNESAVKRLRELKHRPQKPFAVMMKDLDTAKKYCHISPEEEAILTGSEKPILLLKKKEGMEAVLPEAVAPSNPTIGVMLPYTPLHLLLFSYPDGQEFTDVLVMTSGNRSGAPITGSTEEAVRDLAGLCDVILTNDRKIRLRADDSVLSLTGEGISMIRRSRGYAPLPILSDENETHERILAFGGDLKNTVTLFKAGLYYPSPYIGDLEDVRSMEAQKQAIKRLEKLLEINPSVLVCDLHPKYHSALFAKQYGEEHSISVLPVQHHFAHVRSCTAENGFFEESVIGVAFDGTGFGTDGTIWGGEFFIAKPDSFVRVGSIAPFDMAGGDAAAREGWRIAVSLLLSGDPKEGEDRIKALALCSQKELSLMKAMLRMHMNTAISTSMGRLFDAVSAILGIRLASTFEGEASMALQFAAEAWEKESHATIHREPLFEVLPFREEEDGVEKGQGKSDRRFVISYNNVITYLAEERLRGETSVKELSWLFHKALADAVLEGCKNIRDRSGLDTVALSGGVFQNQLLTKMVKEALEEADFKVLLHHELPANDGGLSLGQAAIARAIGKNKKGGKR